MFSCRLFCAVPKVVSLTSLELSFGPLELQSPYIKNLRLSNYKGLIIVFKCSNITYFCKYLVYFVVVRNIKVANFFVDVILILRICR